MLAAKFSWNVVNLTKLSTSPMTYAIIDIRENLAFEYHFESVENPKLVEITAP